VPEVCRTQVHPAEDTMQATDLDGGGSTETIENFKDALFQYDLSVIGRYCILPLWGLESVVSRDVGIMRV